MKKWYFRELTINGKHYVGEDLIKHCEKAQKEASESWENELYAFILEWINDLPSISASTSGSTGQAKRIEIEKEKMVNSAQMTCTYFHLNEGQTALLCLPAKYIAGKMMIVRSFVGRLNLLITKPNSNPLSAFQPQKIDFVAMTPMQALQAINESHSKAALAKIDQLILGGAPIDNDLKKELVQLPTSFYETYGMTETITHVAIKKISSIENNAFEVLPNVSIELDNRNCLIIKAPELCDSKITTNDVVELIDATHFIWKGRYDFIINTGGVKVNPEEIEKQLSAFISEQFVISSRPDKLLGEKIVLIIASAPYSKVKEVKLKQALDKHLEKHVRPKEIKYQASFPKSGFGKVNRIALKRV